MGKKHLYFILIILFFISCKAKTIDQESLVMFADGKTSYQQGDLEYALETFLELEKRSPDFTESSIMLGKTYYFLEEYENGILYLEKKWEKKPYIYELGYWLGRSYVAIDDLDSAENIFLKLNSYNSQDFRVKHQLGLIKMSSGDYLKAMDFFKTSLLQRNELAQISLSLGQIYYSQDLIPEAINSLEDTLSIGHRESPISFAAKEIIREIEFRSENENN